MRATKWSISGLDGVPEKKFLVIPGLDGFFMKLSVRNLPPALRPKKNGQDRDFVLLRVRDTCRQRAGDEVHTVDLELWKSDVPDAYAPVIWVSMRSILAEGGGVYLTERRGRAEIFHRIRVIDPSVCYRGSKKEKVTEKGASAAREHRATGD